MCLALPAKVIRKSGDFGEVELSGNRYKVNFVMTPEVKIGEYVLVHAGYAIQIVPEEDAKETWELLIEAEGKLE